MELMKVNSRSTIKHFPEIKLINLTSQLYLRINNQQINEMHSMDADESEYLSESKQTTAATIFHSKWSTFHLLCSYKTTLLALLDNTNN